MPDNFGAPVPLKKETDPFGTAVPLSNAGPPVAPVPKVNMQTSWAPRVVRAATSALPAIGATAGGLITAPGIVTSALGTGLGAAAGKSTELAANRAIFGNDEPSPMSLPGIARTAEEGASYALPAAGMEAGTRALLGAPMETGFRGIAPPFVAAPIRDWSLAAQRQANREAEEDTASFMSKGYKPAEEANLSQAVRQGRAARVPPRIAAPEQPVEPKMVTIPSPNEATPGIRPGAMWSTKRANLAGLAQAGTPGAGDVLQSLGTKVLYTVPAENPEAAQAIKRLRIPPPEVDTSRIIAAPEEEDEELPPIRDRAAD